jgi:hypothetical protein
MLPLARRLSLLLLIAAVLPPALAAPPFAASSDQPGTGWLAGRGGGASSSAEAAQRSRSQTGGKVLSVRKVSDGYQVRVLTPRGEVRVLFIPAT